MSPEPRQSEAREEAVSSARMGRVAIAVALTLLCVATPTIAPWENGADAAWSLRLNGSGFVVETPHAERPPPPEQPTLHPRTVGENAPRSWDDRGGVVVKPGSWYAWEHVGVVPERARLDEHPGNGTATRRVKRAPPTSGWNDALAASAAKRKRASEPGLSVLFQQYGGVDEALRTLRAKANAFDDERDESDDEEKSKTWDLMGNAYRVKGESDAAFDCFERALELKPNANSYLHYGGALRAAGDLEESVRLFGLGLELAPRHTLLRYNLGIVYAETGRLKEASTSLKAALSISPKFKPARELLCSVRNKMRSKWLPQDARRIIHVVSGFVLLVMAVHKVISKFHTLGVIGGTEGGNGGRGTGAHGLPRVRTKRNNNKKSSPRGVASPRSPHSVASSQGTSPRGGQGTSPRGRW